MDYQMSLFNINLERKESELSKMKIIAWNIQNSSKDRANKQFKWIYEVNPDILVLTEVTLSAGFALIKTELEMQGYDFVYKESDSYFTVVAIRNYNFQYKELNLSYLSERTCCIEIESPIGLITIVGVYAPTCSRDNKKIVDKIKFHEELYNEVIEMVWKNQNNAKVIVIGDLNFLEPKHKPIYLEFSDYYKYYNKFNEYPFKDLYRVRNPDTLEYSWSGQGIVQRLDHVFVTENVLPFVNSVEYLHNPRKSKISDHSALYININFNL